MAAEETVSEKYVKREGILPPLVHGTRGFGSKFDVQLPAKNGKFPLRMGYGCQQLVWIRNLEQPLDAFCYEGHVGKGDVKAFAFHPRAGWGLSGDDKGNGRVWTVRKVEPICKNEVMCGKAINDVCWSPDGKKIAFAGVGQEEAGKCTPWDTNNHSGIFQDAGHAYLCVAYRPIRPFNLTIAGEGCVTRFYKGPPFKTLLLEERAHKKYVNDVEYSKCGKYIATCSSDKQICLYFAKTVENLRMWGKKGGHKGSIYGVAWGDNDKANRIATASADKTIMIWALPESDEFKGSGEISCIATIDIGEKDICDMQSYIVWKGDTIYASSQNGDITIINADIENDEYSIRETLTGHKSGVTAATIIPNTNISISADNDGKVVRTNWDDGSTHLFRGTGHGKRGYCKYLYSTPDGTGFYSGANNDTILYSDLSTERLGEETFKTEGAIRFVCGTAGLGNLALVGTSKNHLYCFDGINVVCDIEVEHDVYQADSVTLKNGNVQLFVPSTKTIEVYDVSEGGVIEHCKSIELFMEVSLKAAKRVVCKPEGTHIAVIRADNPIELYNIKSGEREQKSAFQKHLAPCNDCAWFRDGEATHEKLISVGEDLAMRIYGDPFNSGESKEEFHAAAQGLKDVVAFPDGDTFLVTGRDGALRRYSLLE